jgi:hypothetical protein
MMMGGQAKSKDFMEKMRCQNLGWELKNCSIRFSAFVLWVGECLWIHLVSKKSTCKVKNWVAKVYHLS